MLKSRIPNNIAVLFILSPFIFAVLLGVLGVRFPSYLIVVLLSGFLVLIGFNTHFKIKFTLSIRKPLLYQLLFLLWVCFSFSYSISVVYAKDKLIYLIYNTFLPIFVIYVASLFYEKREFHGANKNDFLIKMTYVCCLICSLLLLAFGTVGSNGRFSMPGVENPIWVGRFFGMLVLILFLESKLTKKNILIFMTALLLSLFSLILAGTRTPVVAIFFVLVLHIVRAKGIKYLFPFVLVVFISLAAGFTYSSNYLFDLNFYSVYKRIEFVTRSLSVDWEPFKGLGLGSFGIAMLGEDKTFYPHNLIVEIIFETGLIGLFLFIMLATSFVRSFSGTIFEYLTVYYFLLSLTSGDIPGNNVLFILLFSSVIFKNKFKMV